MFWPCGVDGPSRKRPRLSAPLWLCQKHRETGVSSSPSRKANCREAGNDNGYLLNIAATLTGKGIAKTNGTSNGAGPVKLAVIAKGATKRLLAKTGKAKVLATIVFTPAGGGAAVTAPAAIDLQEHRRPKIG